MVRSSIQSHQKMLGGSQGSSQRSSGNTAKIRAGEESSKEKRRISFIIHKLTESTGSTEEEMRKDDKQVVLDLINNTLGVNCKQEEIKRMFRLGQKKNNDRPLPIELR